MDMAKLLWKCGMTLHAAGQPAHYLVFGQHSAGLNTNQVEMEKYFA
jgi:hypothetical protein